LSCTGFNAQNLTKYYHSKGDTIEVEVVTYGRGLNMLIDGKSPVADRIAMMSLEMGDLNFAACGNTHRKMSKKGVKRSLCWMRRTWCPLALCA